MPGFARRAAGQEPEGTSDERAEQVRDALFGDPPLARALLAWDGEALAGLASYSFLWPAAGLSAPAVVLAIAGACCGGWVIMLVEARWLMPAATARSLAHCS
jgi:hypothetical protein